MLHLFEDVKRHNKSSKINPLPSRFDLQAERNALTIELQVIMLSESGYL